MRRRLNLAGLIQYILMVSLAAVLVLLVLAGASPAAFALALLGGALLAALPAIYIVLILLPRQARTAQQVRKDGLPACARVEADGEQLAADFLRHAGAFKTFPLHIELLVEVLPDDAGLPYPAQMLAPVATIAQLKPEMWLGVRVDRRDPAQVVAASSPPDPLLTWTIRPTQETDLPQLADLIRAAFAEQRHRLDPPASAQEETADSLRTRLQNAAGLVAEADGIPTGCVFYRPEDNYLFLFRLAVLPEMRSRGIARSLLAEAEKIACGRGYTQTRLAMRAEISENLPFYQRLGYQVLESGSHNGYAKITYHILGKSLSV